MTSNATLPSRVATTPVSPPAAPTASPFASLLRVLGRLVVWGALAGLVIAIVYPLLWMILSGFKTNSEIFGDPFGLPGALRWGNYHAAWENDLFKIMVTDQKP